jgi:hypothetical protein
MVGTNPRVFMPPWYQPIPIRSKPTNKLPNQKFQYPTYVKDTNPNAHIKISKRQSELMVKLWRQISSTCLISLYETTSHNGVKTSYKIILTAHLMSWIKHFTSASEL